MESSTLCVGCDMSKAQNEQHFLLGSKTFGKDGTTYVYGTTNEQFIPAKTGLDSSGGDEKYTFEVPWLLGSTLVKNVTAMEAKQYGWFEVLKDNFFNPI